MFTLIGLISGIHKSEGMLVI